MKAILLAGGRGTRLRPLTHTSNKHALLIANKPLIMYPFESILEAGIKDIAVIVNETRAEIEAILGDGSKWGVKIIYIFQEKPLGLAQPINLAEKFIGNSKFVVVLGDNMLQNGIKKEVEYFEKSNLNGHLLGIKVPIAEHPRLGMATLKKEGFLARYIEKPGVVDESKLYNPKRSYAVTGFYFFDAHAVKCFYGKDKIQPSSRGELEIAAPYNWLIEHDFNKITLSEVKGWWKDPGKPEDMLSANKLVLDWKHDFKNQGLIIDSKVEGSVEIMAGAKIYNSQIHGPVTIGQNSVIKDSYIGPYTSLGDNTRVKNAEIENSIVMGDSSIHDILSRINSSIIGWYTEVTEQKELPKATSLFIGDDSVVKI